MSQKKAINNNNDNNNNNNNILLHDSYRSPKAGKWWNKQGRWVKCNISAIVKEAEIDKNVSRKHVDKTHPISGAKNGNQVRIIKLATRRKFFCSISKTKKLITEKRKKNLEHKYQAWLNIQPSLARNRLICLEKPMVRLKVMRISGLLMLICTQLEVHIKQIFQPKLCQALQELTNPWAS